MTASSGTERRARLERDLARRERELRKQLAADLVVATSAFKGFRPNGGAISVPKGYRARRDDAVVQRYADQFRDLTPREVDHLVGSAVGRWRWAAGL